MYPPASRGRAAMDGTFCKVRPGNGLLSPTASPGCKNPSPKLAPLTEGSCEQPAETERVLVARVPWHGGVSELTRLFPAGRWCLSQEGCEFAGLEVVAVPRRWRCRSGVPAAAPASPQTCERQKQAPEHFRVSN